MGELINCLRCGKFFEYLGIRMLCPECFELDEKDFDRIRMYLFDHPGAKIFEVSTDLNIPVSRIKRYLREGRLEIIEKNNMFLKCDICRKPICSGMYCDDCLKQLGHSSEYKSIHIGNVSARSKSELKYIPILKK